MNKISVITSFNRTYYDLIGKFAVASFVKYWPKEIKLICYVEDIKIENHKRITQIPFTELPASYFEFQNSDYKNRVKTFAKKGYSIIHAMEKVDCDKLIWIDSDVLTTNKVPYNFIDDLCSDQDLAAFMGVWHEEDNKKYFSCESSFFVLNKNHLHFSDFSKRYREYYDNKITDNLRRFYDGEVLGATIQDLTHLGNMVDLNPSTAYKTPMPRSVLNNYFVHYKAGLKDNEDLNTSAIETIGQHALLSEAQ